MKPLLEVMGQADRSELQVATPEEGYHRGLISCQRACPVHKDARGYVRAIAEGRFEEAYLIARGPNPFASICGRICGAPCEAACRRGRIPRMDTDGNFLGNDRPIAIRALKRFVCERYGAEAASPEDVLSRVRAYVPKVAADAEEMAWLLRDVVQGRIEPASGEGVAVIGGGPAGLSAAHDLALLGFRPVVFESERIAGGMLALGVPEYRLPAELIRREIAVIEALGVKLELGVRVGEEVTLKQLRDDFAAVVIAVGAKLSRDLGLPGERGPGVFGGVDFLRSVALAEPVAIGREVVVIGGGNVAYDVARTVVRQAAYDAARTAARLPGRPRVKLVSLETLEEMPADTIEILEGDEEGIERLNGWGPLEILRNAEGGVTGVHFRRCTRVYDENRRFAPVFDDSETLTVAGDTVLMAVGQSTDLSFLEEGGQDVEQFRPGWPKVDPESLATTAPGVFVAGDLAHGTRLLIDAVASGKKAARAVYAYLTGHTLRAQVLESQLTLDRYYREKGYESLRRVEIPVLPPENRLDSPGRLVEQGYSEEEARREASRCLDCGVTPVFDGQRCVLCGGCVDVCPTICLKIVPLSAVALDGSLCELTEELLGPTPDLEENSLILKDEDRCIRCGLCALRCPVDAIAMDRTVFTTRWR
ncbi:MAG TPA: FAD-dependent oxidoreductase [Acidobacteriota bacterium]|nr:FAD-dependent oxidoreductase [Acidobacteriota bacterium]